MEISIIYKKFRQTINCRGKIFIAIAFLISKNLFAQEEKEFVIGAFRGTQLINAQTTEMVKPKSFEFSIRHRFGMIGPDSTIYEQLLGLDLPANIRFSFTKPITQWVNISIGRTKDDKTFDADIKLSILRQTEDNKSPINLVLYFSTAIKSARFPNIPSFAYFADGITPFEYKFNHRLSYIGEIIISRQFSEKIAIQLNPSWVYKNLVSTGLENEMFILPIGFSIKTGMSSSIVAEYVYRFNNRPSKNQYPASIAYEMGTAGHTFQIVISSTSALIQQENFSNNGFDYLKGKFAFGFNINRTFWKKKKKGN